MSGRAGAVLAVLSCPALVVPCILVVDRPAAVLAHAGLSAWKQAFDALTHIVDPVPPLATLGIAAAGSASLVGPGPSAGRWWPAAWPRWWRSRSRTS